MNALTEVTEVVERQSAVSVMMNVDALNAVSKVAALMASGKATVPKHLQGNESDCFAVTMQSMQWGMNPWSVAQKTHLVNGTLGYEAQLVNAVLQSNGAIRGRFHYEYEGSGASVKCRVGAIPSGETAIVWGTWLAASDVSTKNSPLWKANIQQQLGYLQVKNWGRAYAPGAILGVYTPDELEIIPAKEKDMGPVERVPETLPDLANEKFEAMMPQWGKSPKTAAELIAVLETKYTLTGDQKSLIEMMKELPKQNGDQA